MIRRSLLPLCASTLLLSAGLLTGCPALLGGSNNSPKPTINAPDMDAIAEDPFAGISFVGGLQQAAGFGKSSLPPGLVTVAPLQQASGYRISALTPVATPTLPVDIAYGPYRYQLTYTSELSGVDDEGHNAEESESTYTLKALDSGNEVEKGTGSDRFTWDDSSPDRYIESSRRITVVTKSSLSPVGIYDYQEALTETATQSLTEAHMTFAPQSGASRTLSYRYDDRFTGTGDDRKITSSIISITGVTPGGTSTEGTINLQYDGNTTHKQVEAGCDLSGGAGRIRFTNHTVNVYNTPTDDTEPYQTQVTGTFSVVRLNPQGRAVGEIHIEEFTCYPERRSIEVRGELRNPQGEKIGTYEGTINHAARIWKGSYQLKGRASAPIDLSGLLLN